MSAEKLNKWAELLLDTGKRNNLIHFKDTKVGTAEVLAPDYVTLFTKVEHSTAFEVYDPKLEAEEEEEAVNSEWEELTAERRVSRQEYLEKYSKKLKKNQILVYNIDNKPLTALKNVSKKAKIAVEETGVNIAYMAFGFIHWFEEENPQQIMRAPILLAPIKIENESPVQPYYIKMTDDEIIVNPTFAFKLQNEFGLKLPDFDEDDGIDGYFTKIQELVSKLKWWVSAECKIGIFSFLKINMYKDLKDNTEKILQNGDVKVLLGDKGAKSSMDGVQPVPATKLLDLHNVVDADSSQAEAIEMALAGKSFVLQGPPGTGKSQTITNIIAECLLAGKKVLFVSEKLAALNVVYEKLKNAGLEEFCLELHSHKANKKQVIEELCHTLKLPKSRVSQQADKELKAKKDAQAYLDAYTEELHKVCPIIQKTPYELYEEAAACRHAPSVDFFVSNIKEKGEDFIEKAEAELTRFVDYISSVGYDYHQNIWYGYTQLGCSYQEIKQVKEDLFESAALGRALQEIGGLVKEKYQISADTLTFANAFSKFFALVKGSKFITPSLLNPTTLKKLAAPLQKAQALAKEILQTKAVLDKSFDEDVYKLDGKTLHKQLTIQFEGGLTRLFSGEYRRVIASIRLNKKDGKKPNYKEAVEMAGLLRRYQEKTAEFKGAQASVEKLVGHAYVEVNSDFERCMYELAYLTRVHETGVRFGKLLTMTREEFMAQKAVFAELAKRYETAFLAYGESEKRLLARFDAKEYDLRAADLVVYVEKCEQCYENTDKLDNWCEFVKLLKGLEALELRSFVDEAIEAKIPPSEMVRSYKKAFYLQWIDTILRESPVLSGLARVPHDEMVKRFVEKDRLHFEISKAKIKAELSHQRPTLDLIAQGSSISILLREGEKKRKQKGIRLLLSEIGELAQTLKPCFLMSPLSVSTYLGADIAFDLVIFDEASQIFPQDAVGAIYRGKQLIVVGDSKQMPPSNFFSATVETDEEEAEDVTDFESILDICSTAFPQRRLQWHYRSRFEQLIAFSNKHFYDNDLVTFPSAKTDTAGVGVDYVHVNGVFDRSTKTNRAEAEKIVEMVFEHIQTCPERSLGVVAFSVSQQSLIEKLISKRRQQDPSKDAFFKSDKIEPFFVKNLETVQGDERDTIIFSIAYAKDAQGRFLLNFGPINRDGGERRLNVAVTRAKMNVKVVASIHATDIDLGNSKSVGARLLRDYLAYAENGGALLQRAEQEDAFACDLDLETEVAEFLRKQGYIVDTQVGCSSFKIDLAVKKEDSADYVLAVECDGPSYRASKTTRDRDRLRKDILERMGWTFYRVWSTDWVRNKRLEKERLLMAVKEAFEHAEKKVKKNVTKPNNNLFEEQAEEQHFEFPKYQMQDELALSKKLNYDVMNTVRAILEYEAPMSEEWLLKRIVFLFGKREKVTVVVRNAYETLMQNCRNYGIVRQNGFLYLLGRETPMLRVPAKDCEPREVKYIETQELANGLRALLKQNVTVEKDGLFRLMAAQLGFARIGEAMEVKLEEALSFLKDEIEQSGETLSLKTDLTC